MSRSLTPAFCLSIVLSSAVSLSAAEKRPPARTDALGDPLPPGAVARLGTTRLWHGASIGGVALSPDGKVVATGGNHQRLRDELEHDNTIRVWDTTTGRELRRFTTPDGGMRALCYSPDGKLLAAHCGGLVLVLDAVSGRELHRFQHQNSGQSDLQFSADGKILKLSDVYSVGTWDLATGRHRRWSAPRQLGNGGCKYGGALSPDGRLVAWSLFPFDSLRPQSPDRESHVGICICDAATGKECYEVPLPLSSGVGPPVFSPDSKLLAVPHPDGFLLLKAATGKEVRKYSATVPGILSRLTFTPDGKILSAVCNDRTIHLFDLVAGTELRQLPCQLPWGGGSELYWISEPHQTFSADGQTLAVTTTSSVYVWDVRSGAQRPAWPGHREPVEFLGFSRDGRQLTSAAEVLYTWRTADWRKQSRKAPGFVPKSGLALSADLRLLAAELDDGKVTLLETATEKVLFRRRHPNVGRKEAPELAAAFSADGRKLILLTPRKVRWLVEVHDVVSGKLQKFSLKDGSRAEEKTTSPESINGIAASADGRLLAWFDQDYRVFLADLQAGQAVRQLVPGSPAGIRSLLHSLLTFSPDSRYLAAVHEGKEGGYAVRVWEVEPGQEVWRLGLHQQDGEPAEASCLSFSPDGRLLALARYDEDKVRLWEVASGQQRHTFAGHRSAVSSLAISPDGKLLASGSHDTTVLIWDLDGARPGRPGAEELEALWTDLGGADGQRVHEAIRTLAHQPAEAVPFLAARLQPAAAPEPERLARLVAELGDKRFAVRERAVRELEHLHSLVEPALRQALGRDISLEMRRRLEQLLQKVQGPVTLPALLRALRGVEALEHAATPEARQTLQALAGGAPEARLTREARAALGRLNPSHPGTKVP